MLLPEWFYSFKAVDITLMKHVSTSHQSLPPQSNTCNEEINNGTDEPGWLLVACTFPLTVLLYACETVNDWPCLVYISVCAQVHCFLSV